MRMNIYLLIVIQNFLQKLILENKDDSQLRLGLNEIYARHHCTFKTPEIADYFKSKVGIVQTKL